ncbi:Solute carrier family 22 member 6 [Portunus trituberculatus]|uniref:Solute carrier family 22 member 6 n=1 Tax=Portunus trituberculatus TaxID=210409 RepID=A0A5B7CVA2_PORTR|nr:Solute carrier family 22 member 6 [Portunus trituberculatus]
MSSHNQDYARAPLSAIRELQVLRVSLALVGKWCISGVYQVLYLYASELFPTEVRMQGIGVASVSSQLASTFVPFITSLLGSALPWLPSFIFGIAAAVAGMFTMALRDTKDVPLPDTIADLSAAAIKEAVVFNRDSLSTITSSTIFSITTASAPDVEKKGHEDDLYLVFSPLNEVDHDLSTTITYPLTATLCHDKDKTSSSALSEADVEGPAVAGSARFTGLKKEDMEEGSAVEPSAVDVEGPAVAGSTGVTGTACLTGLKNE